MEFAFTIMVAILCLYSQTQTAKTVMSILWLAVLFVFFITSPDE